MNSGSQDGRDNQVGALWEKTSKSGERYFNLKFGEEYYKVFKNRFKDAENKPDWVIVKDKPKPLPLGSVPVSEKKIKKW